MEENPILTLVKNSLRIDGSTDDTLLNKMISAAQSNIKGQVGSATEDFYTKNDEFDWAVVLLVSNWYINRSATVGVQNFETPLAFENLILSLKEDYLVMKAKEEKETDDS